MASRPASLRNLAAVVVLLVAVGGGAPYPERVPSQDKTAVAEEFEDEEPDLAVDEGLTADASHEEQEPPAHGGASASGTGHTVHVVGRGETLSALAARYRVGVPTLASLNNLANPNLIQVGQRLLIPAADGFVYRVRAGDTLWGLSRTFGVPQQTITEANGLANPSRLRIGQTLVIPGGGQPTASAKTGTTAFIWPVTGGRLSSPFGPRRGRLHTGIDIAVPLGTPIRAAASGTVISAGWLGGYGRTVMVRHADGSVTLYAHASKLLVRRGQHVAQGQVIARVGSSGNSTGPHLHFEIIVESRPRDPMLYLNRATASARGQ